MEAVLFVARNPIEKTSHLETKFRGQRQAVASLGYDVWHLGWDSNYLYLFHDEEKYLTLRRIFPILPGYYHAISYMDLSLAAMKAVKERHFDYVYLRHSPIWATTALMAHKINSSGAKLICEIPSYPSAKEPQKNLARKLFQKYSYIWQQAFYRKITLFTIIGNPSPGTYHDKPAINIDNGICLSGLPLRKPSCSSGEIHILALGAMCPWHGFDRLIQALASYHGEFSVVIHMVGDNAGGALPKWKALAHSLHLDRKVLFHGALYGRELAQIFDQCDIGVGTIGAYRKDVFVGTPLKNRDYTARGLPFVDAIEDPALAGTSNFFLPVANNDNPLDMNEIVEFALKTRKDKHLPKRMRRHAEAHMTWEEQFKKVFFALNALES